MTQEEKVALANSMLNPVRCGGMSYDKEGNPMWIHGGKLCNIEEHNNIVRAANPTWTEEQISPYLYSEDATLKNPEYVRIKNELIERRKDWKDCDCCGRCAPTLRLDENAAKICSACVRKKIKKC